MKIGVIGLGHVGLPTAAVLAKLGHDVAATDADAEKMDVLERGGAPFYEPGLEDLVNEVRGTGRLAFRKDLREVVDGSKVVFLCVGTPPKTTGEANLAMIEQAAADVATHATTPLVVADKSTVPAGTAERVAETLTRYRPDGSFQVVSNPEFLREGNAVVDSLHPDRILVGSDSPEAHRVMREVYEPLIRDGAGWIETDLRTAELAKHACNAFLAMKVSFANALARICEAAGADVVSVTRVMGADPRIGPAHLSAGLGYGGYCFPKDLQAFERLATRLGYDFPLLREVERINDEAVDAAFHRIEEVVWNMEGKRVAVLGLAFKPGTDDIRFSPSIALTQRLLEAGAEVTAYDPQAAAGAKAELPALQIANDAYDALEGAHCAVIATEWPEFRELDLDRMRGMMAFPIIVDCRNLLDDEAMAAAGFTYFPTGRPPVRP
ncbi:MAG: UDP-glucose/GDP-mannose dehydrogenase family protein [Actinomycetota bacterium]|nr:UDP-glucose/GDP-mannose dehydrogenase family protein [Actinomycetota bacterium]